jgi:ketosteroid isomerase-like protein
MSREDAELVKRVYEVDGPFWLPLSPGEERALLDQLFGGDLYDDQFEVLMPPDYPEGAQVYVGRPGMVRLIGLLRDSWTTWRFEAERFIDAGHSVIALIRVVAEGEHSGLGAVQETAHVWKVRGGRLASIQIYRDRAQALEATGVSDRSAEGGDA